ncbi:MAG: hypothetical protein FWB76_07430 [Oscillospiraceae bacterium]|nr:hypothetical protein [Oscillospiraceae bacterium]
MKHAKKLLAILLAMLVLGSIAAVPAAANDVPAGTPVITQQPSPLEFTIVAGETFTLSVQAYIPNGDPVAFQWMRGSSVLVNHTQATYTRTTDARATSGVLQYHVRVYNANDSHLPWSQRRVVASETVRIRVEERPPTLWQRFVQLIQNIFRPIWNLLRVPLIIALIALTIGLAALNLLFPSRTELRFGLWW